MCILQDQQQISHGILSGIQQKTSLPPSDFFIFSFYSFIFTFLMQIVSSRSNLQYMEFTIRTSRMLIIMSLSIQSCWQNWHRWCMNNESYIQEQTLGRMWKVHKKFVEIWCCKVWFTDIHTLWITIQLPSKVFLVYMNEKDLRRPQTKSLYSHNIY